GEPRLPIKLRGARGRRMFHTVAPAVAATASSRPNTIQNGAIPPLPSAAFDARPFTAVALDFAAGTFPAAVLSGTAARVALASRESGLANGVGLRPRS